MRIAFISQHYPPENSGNASRIHDMAHLMAAEGAEVTVVCPHPTFPTGSFPRTWKRSEEYQDGPVRVVRLWAWQPQASDPAFASRTSYYLAFPVHAARWARKNADAYDVLIGSTPPSFTTIPGMRLGRRRKDKTVVVEVRDLWIDAAVALGFTTDGSLATRAARRLEAKAFRDADLIATTTGHVAEHVRGSLPNGEGGKVFVAANGVDTERFRPLEVPKKEQFVYTGNIGHAQALDQVIQAVAIVARDHPDVRLVLAGDGDTKAPLIELAQELGCSQNVVMPGIVPREQVPQLLSESLAGVAPLLDIPDLAYALPTKAYEYMACGLPWIGTGRGEIAILAAESGAGVMARTTPESIAEAMRSCLNGSRDVQAMGVSGRDYVVTHCDRVGVARAYLGALTEVSA